MAFEIRKPPLAPSPKSKPVKRGAYLDFIRRLPCAVSGTRPVEAAHLSTANPPLGHWGRGKGSKVSDRWTLPLSPDAHIQQHRMNELGFWASHGIDPHVLALTLFGIWSDLDEDEALIRAEAIINQGLAQRGKLPTRGI